MPMGTFSKFILDGHLVNQVATLSQKQVKVNNILVERGLPFLPKDRHGRLSVAWKSTIFKLVGQGG